MHRTSPETTDLEYGNCSGIRGISSRQNILAGNPALTMKK
jgi:hypothetical protein